MEATMLMVRSQEGLDSISAQRSNACCVERRERTPPCHPRRAARGWQSKVARGASHGSEWYGALGGCDKNGPSDAKERKHGNGEAKISHGG